MAKKKTATKRRPAAEPDLDHIAEDLRPLAVAIGELKVDPENARTHDEANIEAIAASLKEFGQLKPVVANRRNGQLLAGNGTLEAARRLGWTHLAVVWGEYDAKAQRGFSIADNRTAELAGWNDELLLEQIDLLREETPDLAAALQLAELEATLQKPGFRPGAGPVADQVKEWRGAEKFFAVPPAVRETLAEKKQFVVEFSGGKDSLAALLWASRNYPDRRRIASYVDTGVEFPGLGAYVSEVAERLGAEPVILKPAKEWWSWLQKCGEWPSLLYRRCMFEFIHEPWAKFVRKNCPPAETAVFTGSRAEEAGRGSKKSATSPLNTLGKGGGGYAHFAPCFAVRKPVLEKVIAESGVPVWDGYARGFVRTACWCCMGQRGEQACALEDNYPGLANEIRRWEKRLGPLQPLANPRSKTFDDIVRAGRKRLAAATSKAEKNRPSPGG